MTADNVRRVTPEQAKEIMDRGEGALFVDARNPTAWSTSTSKIPGAIRVPVEEVQDHLGELPRDRQIIVYCT